MGEPCMYCQVPNNFGHGYVHPRRDGIKAKCGGPAICSICAREKAYHDEASGQTGTPSMDSTPP